MDYDTYPSLYYTFHHYVSRVNDTFRRELK